MGEKRVATIILNRNLPEPTNKLCQHLQRYDGDVTDIFVVEAGSDKEKLSKYATWHVNDEETLIQGLRYPRGMNFALYSLYKDDKLDNYDAFFLLTNDTILNPVQTIKPLSEIFDKLPQVGILSPCSKEWGEARLLGEDDVKFFWHIHTTAYFLRREFIKEICDFKAEQYTTFLFDGTNFRGFLAEVELIAKAYANDWTAAITSKVWAEEDESHLLTLHDMIKTEPYDLNIRMYIDEGLEWIHKKYGFKSHWQMQQYVIFLYNDYFKRNPSASTFMLSF